MSLFPARGPDSDATHRVPVPAKARPVAYSGPFSPGSASRQMQPVPSSTRSGWLSLQAVSQEPGRAAAKGSFACPHPTCPFAPPPPLRRSQSSQPPGPGRRSPGQSRRPTEPPPAGIVAASKRSAAIWGGARGEHLQLGARRAHRLAHGHGERVLHARLGLGRVPLGGLLQGVEQQPLSPVHALGPWRSAPAQAPSAPGPWG